MDLAVRKVCVVHACAVVSENGTLTKPTLVRRGRAAAVPTAARQGRR